MSSDAFHPVGDLPRGAAQALEASLGGGRAALHPQAVERPKTLDTWFEFELELPATQAFVLGEHVYARFVHPPEPVGLRLYRSVRQLFLKRFLV